MSRTNVQDSFGFRFCKAVGINPNRVKGVTLTSRVGDADRVVVDMYLDRDDIKMAKSEIRVMPILKHRRSIPIERRSIMPRMAGING